MGIEASKGSRPSADFGMGSDANTLNELQILEGHEDMVRFMVKIDHSLLATASDDSTIKVWNFRQGTLARTLAGHSRPVTCLQRLTAQRLASGSSDNQILIWDVYTGALLKRLQYHTGAIQCIVRVSSDVFCSGANDKKLCLWNADGASMGSIERQEEENLHCMLTVRNRLITGSNSSLLLVYDTETLAFMTLLEYHRESIRCLTKLSDTHFASGSLDGAIIIWHAETMKPAKILNFPDKYRNDEHIYVHHVRFMVSMGDRYLAAAVGNGFCVYDTVSVECVLEVKDAHDAAVLSLISVHDGSKIITSSEDSSVKVWASGVDLTPEEASTTMVQGLRFFRRKKRKSQPVCIGEMWIHTGAVNQLLQLDESSFASCSSDNLTILWKDGRVQSQLRNNFATASLLLHQVSSAQEEARANERSTAASGVGAGGNGNDGRVADHRDDGKGDQKPVVSPVGNIGRSETVLSSDAREGMHDANAEMPMGSSALSNSSLNWPTGLSVDAACSNREVPRIIWEFAEMLRVKEHRSLEEVAQALEEQGHSMEIIATVRERQEAL